MECGAHSLCAPRNTDCSTGEASSAAEPKPEGQCPPTHLTASTSCASRSPTDLSVLGRTPMDPEACGVHRAPHQRHPVGTRTTTKRKQTTREVLEAPHWAETNKTPTPEDKKTQARAQRHPSSARSSSKSKLNAGTNEAGKQHRGNEAPQEDTESAMTSPTCGAHNSSNAKQTTPSPHHGNNATSHGWERSRSGRAHLVDTTYTPSDVACRSRS